MRDRLIELLCDIECKGEDFRNGGCAFRKDERCIKIDNLDMCMIGCIADNLLANGVIVPPCKVGDTVYEIQLGRGRIQAYEVITIKYNGHFWYMLWKLKDDEGIYGTLDGFVDSELGKTVFLTREEAEKALAERSAE